MGTLFNQEPYYRKVHSKNVVGLVNEIKEVQRETGLDFFEAIQVYELKLKIVKADSLDEQLAGFGKLLDDFVGVAQYEFGSNLSDSLKEISFSLDFIGNTMGNFQFFDKERYSRLTKEEKEENKKEFIESLYITYSSLNDDHAMIHRLTERPVKDIFEHLIKLYKYDFGGFENRMIKEIDVNDFIKVVTETSTLKYDEQTGYFI